LLLLKITDFDRPKGIFTDYAMPVVSDPTNHRRTESLVGTDILGVFVHPQFQHQGFGKAIMKGLEKRRFSIESGKSRSACSFLREGSMGALGTRQLNTTVSMLARANNWITGK
jgi:GNAT superfamily N-acetyltransferase